MSEQTERLVSPFNAQQYEHVRRSCSGMLEELLTRAERILEDAPMDVSYRSAVKQTSFADFNDKGQTLSLRAEWPVERDVNIYKGRTGEDVSGRPLSSTLGSFKKLDNGPIRELVIEVIDTDTVSGVPATKERTQVVTAAPASDPQLLLLQNALFRLSAID